MLDRRVNPFSALEPYQDGRAWELAARGDPPRARAQSVAEKVLGFLATPEGWQLARLPGPGPVWHLALWRRGGLLTGARVLGAPPGTGRGFRTRMAAGRRDCLVAAVHSRRPGAAAPAKPPLIVVVRWRAETADRPRSTDRGPTGRPWTPILAGRAFAAPSRASPAWTGTYYDRPAVEALPPAGAVAEAVRLGRLIRCGAGQPARGCLVITCEGGRVEGGAFCPGLPPQTGSALTRRIRSAVATHDPGAALPVLCVDHLAERTWLLLVSWR